MGSGISNNTLALGHGVRSTQKQSVNKTKLKLHKTFLALFDIRLAHFQSFEYSRNSKEFSRIIACRYYSSSIRRTCVAKTKTFDIENNEKRKYPFKLCFDSTFPITYSLNLQKEKQFFADNSRTLF